MAQHSTEREKSYQGTRKYSPWAWGKHPKQSKETVSGFLGGSVVQNPPPTPGDMGLIPDLEWTMRYLRCSLAQRHSSEPESKNLLNPSNKIIRFAMPLEPVLCARRSSAPGKPRSASHLPRERKPCSNKDLKYK